MLRVNEYKVLKTFWMSVTNGDIKIQFTKPNINRTNKKSWVTYKKGSRYLDYYNKDNKLSRATKQLIDKVIKYVSTTNFKDVHRN